MNELIYVVCDGFRATRNGFLAVDKELKKQAKFNKRTALFAAAVTIYICTNEIRARYQDEEIQKLKKKVKKIEKG